MTVEQAKQHPNLRVKAKTNLDHQLTLGENAVGQSSPSLLNG
jgi:hypothetical protein